MSVLIKGMKMPSHCMDCPFMVSRDNDDCILQSAEANGNFENWEQMKAGCHLVSVQQHGRLIDADALKEEFPKDTDWEYPVNTNQYVCEMIDNAKTVIDAEDE